MMIICIFIGLLFYVGFIYSDYVNNTRKIRFQAEEISNLEWIFIKSVIFEDYLAAQNQARLVADHLTARLKEAYPDLTVLKDEFEHPEKYPQPQYLRIMKYVTKDVYFLGIENDDNDILICTREGILLGISHAELQQLSKNNKLPTAQTPIYLWNDVYANSPNPLALEHAVQLIFQQSDNLIFTEKYSSHTDPEAIHLSRDASLNELYVLYQQYGIDAFKNIQFFAPAYITTTGDIFGTDDSILHTENKNHKIAVIQTFNLYQQLHNRYTEEITKFKDFRHSVIFEPATALNTHIIFILLIVASICGLTIIMLISNDKK